VSTGLVIVEPAGVLGIGLTEWIERQQADPDLPPMRYPDSHFCTVNGCPLSMGAHRTYYLEAGDYFLNTMTAAYTNKCDNFDVRMTCSDGGETASPADSNPLGFSVDANTGAIIGVPERPRDGSPYKMRLRAVDAANVREQRPNPFWFAQWGKSNGCVDVCARCAHTSSHKVKRNDFNTT